MDRKPQRTLEDIARQYGRYEAGAYAFIFQSLDHMLGKLPARRHVSGAELAHAVRELALERFGFLARAVLESWGVKRTDDLGEIVYHLIEAGIMSRTDEDKKSDFNGVYDFHEAFDLGYFKPTTEPPKK